MRKRWPLALISVGVVILLAGMARDEPPARRTTLRFEVTAARGLLKGPTDGRILVVLQLDGGNDGLNTVVPHTDEAYAQSRPRLRLPLAIALRLRMLCTAK